jgi:CubicO group peptidase (beta-lactamase class C family)
VHARGFGVRHLASGEAFAADAVHRIVSMTKPMTSMLAATKVDAGLFDGIRPCRESIRRHSGLPWADAVQ